MCVLPYLNFILVKLKLNLMSKNYSCRKYILQFGSEVTLSSTWPGPRFCLDLIESFSKVTCCSWWKVRYDLELYLTVRHRHYQVGTWTNTDTTGTSTYAGVKYFSIEHIHNIYHKVIITFHQITMLSHCKMLSFVHISFKLKAIRSGLTKIHTFSLEKIF